MVRSGAARGQGQPVDVLVLTVIPAELEAARQVFEGHHVGREKGPDGTVYFRSAVRSELAGRDYGIVQTCIGGPGNPAAAAATVSAIAMYQPRAALLMGIAAGVRGKLRIGEVVLSDRIVAYEPAALVGSIHGAKEEPRPEIDRAPHTMIQDVVSYRTEPARLRAAFIRAGGAIPKAPPGREDEFSAHVVNEITWRQGTIASGEKLIRDPAKLLAVRGLHGKTEVGEMEAAGFVDGCRRVAVPWLVIRGISDFGDDFKDDRFHEFASRTAAAVLFDFIAYGLDVGEASDPDSVGSTTLRQRTRNNSSNQKQELSRMSQRIGDISDSKKITILQATKGGDSQEVGNVTSSEEVYVAQQVDESALRDVQVDMQEILRLWDRSDDGLRSAITDRVRDEMAGLTPTGTIPTTAIVEAMKKSEQTDGFSAETRHALRDFSAAVSLASGSVAIAGISDPRQLFVAVPAVLLLSGYLAAPRLRVLCRVLLDTVRHTSRARTDSK